MIIVTNENFDECVDALTNSYILSVDCETLGLYPYKKDRLFSIQFSDAHEDYYFNFHEYDENPPVLSFSKIKDLQILFTHRFLFLQNAKFDMHFLNKEGITFSTCKIHDTEVVGRLLRNDHMKYSLDEQCKRELGEAKDDSVMEYLKKNKKYTAHQVPGKDTVYKAFHFEEAPYELITKYGCKDTRLTYSLGMKQLEQLKEINDDKLKAVYDMEADLVHTCFEIERVGVQIDREYCEKAVEFESHRIAQAERLFSDQTGVELVDSGKCLGPIFQGLGFSPGKTETGEHEITDSFLAGVTHPLGEIIRNYRDARKRANTYFRSYLYFADKNGAIHANMKQSGTKTGRFSYMDPNLQNIPSEGEDGGDTSPFPIRRAFVPRDGYFFLSVDYKQMEFRMMLDEAGQHDLIEKIKAGFDPHDATAELTGLSRKQAKTLNFGLLYGMGVGKLGEALKVLTEDASRFKRQYFAALPMVENFIRQCTGAVNIRHQRDPGNGWIRTWFGRRSYFSDSNWSYKAANAKIQGGCADGVKIAMNRLHSFLRNRQSRMVLQVHDELLFEMSFEEMDLISEIMQILETAYPHRFLPLTCSMGYSLKSFYDIIEKDPRVDLGKEARNSFQGQDKTSAATTA